MGEHVTIRYFNPADVKVEVVDGKRVAHLDFSLPVIWTDAAIARTDKDFISGWEMARQAYRDSEWAIRLQKYNPRLALETELLKKWFKAGRSLSSWRAFWITVPIVEEPAVSIERML